MRTRDAFVRTDFSELNQLFLHLDSRRQLSRRWWRPQVLAWCRTSATIEHGDMRPHVVSFIDRIFELDWTEERLQRLLDNHALVSFPLPPDLMLAELLTDIQSLIRADLEVHPVCSRRARRRQARTRLHGLLEGKAAWDDATWFQTQRYLLDHFTRLGMQLFVILAGCDPSGAARYFKTDAVKLLHEIPPREVLRAWQVWRMPR